jgi:sigma-B regulation protein RsbU (phosphoserine phosphatase)
MSRLKKKRRFTLGKKIVLLTLLMCSVFCAASVTVSYRLYSTDLRKSQQRLGENLDRTLASELTPEDLDRYYGTGKTDERYYEIQDFLLKLADNNDVKYLYVVRPNGDGVTFLFDSDLRADTDGDYYSGGNCSLGTYVKLEGAFAEITDQLLAGKEIRPIIAKDPVYGWLMTAMCPVLHADGTMAGYVMVDVSMTEVMSKEHLFLRSMTALLSLLTIVIMTVYLVFIRRSVIRPIHLLTEAAQAYEGGKNKTSCFIKLQLKSHDELETLSDAFRKMLEEIDRNGREQTQLAVREERLETELQLANEINAAMLPKALPASAGEQIFEIRGHVERARELSSCFFDYFLLENGRLCVVIGEVPGEGMSAGLFMVVARTTVKSQLRSGLPLVEAMTAANQQLYEIGGGMALEVLVGILEEDGAFSYINAGQCSPLLMRSKDRYEWMQEPVYAPLGQNENVVYQARQVTLRWEDRFFFCTGGLSRIKDSDGTEFSKRQMQVTLNVSRSRKLTPDDLLRCVGDEGKAYAAHPEEVGSFAVLLLEYRRTSRYFGQCIVSPDREGENQITQFLKQQLLRNGCTPRGIAQVAVLAGELFTVCCWKLEKRQTLCLECAVDPTARSVTLRVKASFGGKNPLDGAEGTAAAQAVRFIRESAGRVGFAPGDLEDVLSVEKRLEETELKGNARES